MGAPTMADATRRPETAELILSLRLRDPKFWVQIIAGLIVATGGNFTYADVIHAVGSLYAWVLSIENAIALFIAGTIFFIIGGVIMLVIGVLLFAARAHMPIIYASTEIFVGIFGATNAFLLVGVRNFPSPTAGIQILGGIYIIVRGLDYMGRGIRGTTLGSRWSRWFPQR